MSYSRVDTELIEWCINFYISFFSLSLSLNPSSSTFLEHIFKKKRWTCWSYKFKSFVKEFSCEFFSFSLFNEKYFFFYKNEILLNHSSVYNDSNKLK